MALLALACVAQPLRAADKDAKDAKDAKADKDPNAVCVECHNDPKTKSESGKSVAVDLERFAASVHGDSNLGCTECHNDPAATALPMHPKKLKAPDCAQSCHDDAVKEYEASVHGKARAGGKSVAATCSSCHGGMHEMRASKDPASRTHFRNIEATCGTCHGDDRVIKEAKLPGGNVVARYHDSIHGEKLRAAKDKQGKAPTCKECHGAHLILPKSDPESSTSREKSVETCGDCHGRIKRTFDRGSHGKLRAEGKTDGPGCIDCHSAHAVQRHDLAKWQVEVIAECGNCHDDFLKTYRDTFHGKVTELGYTRVATCAACHGAHEVRPASDPASPVSAEKRLGTCQKCHEGVNANFAAWDPHANRHDRSRNPVLYYAGLFMDALLAGVFLFFGIHTLFWFVRSLRAVRERRRGGEDKHP